MFQGYKKTNSFDPKRETNRIQMGPNSISPESVQSITPVGQYSQLDPIETVPE